MSKLILVSNREPYLVRRGAGGVLQTQRVGAGLVGALAPAMTEVGGHWISWSGFEREAPKAGESLPERLTVPFGEQTCALRRIPLTERESSLYYYGFAARTLWPLMHLHLGRVQFDPEAWRAYKRVNQRFADAVLEVHEPGDKIWIHDYQLALVPGLLRGALPDARIGFSWHVPWAPPDALRALPWHRELLEGVLGADRIAVALPRYARQLLACTHELYGAELTTATGAEGRVTLNGRTSTIGVHGIGCDFPRWAEWARTSRGSRAVRLRRNLSAEKLVLSVDRLDATRGVMERLRAVERFFDRYPSWRGRLVFCQIAVPSRTRVEEYRDMKREVDGLVDQINTRFKQPQSDWVPIRYQYRSFEPEDLAVYYAAADVALVTPLADGVSFVPFEYLAARTREDGVLVLSSLAGAADALPEAMVVNPYDEEAVAATMHAALEMRPEDAKTRMRALRERARQHDVYAWLKGFWKATWSEELNVGPKPITSTPATDRDVETTAVTAAGAGAPY